MVNILFFPQKSIDATLKLIDNKAYPSRDKLNETHLNSLHGRFRVLELLAIDETVQVGLLFGGLK